MKTLLIKILLLLKLTNQNLIINNPYERKTVQDTDEITSNNEEFEIEEEEYNPYTEQEFHDKEFEESLVFFSKYQRLMLIGSTINKFYNDMTNTFPNDEDEEEGYNMDKAKITWELGRLFIETIIKEYKELSEEVMDIYENLDKLDMTVDGCLEFFHFHEYFNTLSLEVDQNSEGFKEIYRELTLSVHEFTFKMRDFFISLNSIRNIQNSLYLFFIPFQNSFGTEDILEKQLLGEKLRKGFLAFYRKAIRKLMFINQGIDITKTIRKTLLEIISKIKYLEKPFVPGLVEKEFLNFVFIAIFFIFVFWI